jgi:hypothetical protein
MSKKIRFPANVESVVLYAVEGSQRVEMKLVNGVGEIFSDRTVDQMVKEGIQEYTGPTAEEARALAEGKPLRGAGEPAPASVPNSPGTDLSNPLPGNQEKPITPLMLEQAQKRRDNERLRAVRNKDEIPEGPVTVEELKKAEAEKKKAMDEAIKQQGKSSGTATAAHASDGDKP